MKNTNPVLGKWPLLLTIATVGWLPCNLSANAPPEQNVFGSTETEVYASKGANLDVKTHVTIFKGDVEVKDPRFQLWCDKLTIYPKKQTDEPKTKTDAQSSDATSPSNIDKVIAEGHVVILQKPAPPSSNPAPETPAKEAIGKADRMEFDNQTGDVFLRGNPSVQQGESEHVATSTSTVMVLNRNSSLRTIGPSRTVIRQSNVSASPSGTPEQPKKKHQHPHLGNNKASPKAQ